MNLSAINTRDMPHRGPRFNFITQISFSASVAQIMSLSLSFARSLSLLLILSIFLSFFAYFGLSLFLARSLARSLSLSFARFTRTWLVCKIALTICSFHSFFHLILIAFFAPSQLAFSLPRVISVLRFALIRAFVECVREKGQLCLFRILR